MTYLAADTRYDSMTYRRCGRSGLKLPAALARPLAQLRRRPHARHPARHHPPRLRPRHHPLRPGQQLRPAVRLGRDQLRPDPRRGPQAVPRRAGHLDQGRLRHVARPVRRVGLAQVPALVSLDDSLQRMGLDYVDIFYSPPLRPGHPARGDDGRARHRRAPGQGAVRRHLVVLRGAHPRGRRDPARPGHAAADPPAVVLDAQPLDRAASCSTRWSEVGAGCIAFTPLAQGLLTDKYLDGIPDGLARGRGQAPRRGHAQRGERSPASAASTRSPRSAGSRSPSWHWRGRCATRG